MKSLLLLVAFSMFSASIFAKEREKEAENPNLKTHVYVVPPTFTSMGKDRRPTAKEILADGGISFPAGASAVYNPGTSQLIVRNTPEQMELVEAYIESIVTGVEKQIFITVREVELQEKPDFPDDWIDPANVQQSKASSGGLTLNDREDLLETLRRPPHSNESDSSIEASGILGVFTEPQFQEIFRSLANKLSSTGTITAPSVMARSGQPALIQIGEKRWGVVPVLRANDDTLDLELFFPPHGEVLRHDSPSLKVSFWDGQTVAWTEEKKSGSCRVVFATARIMDPAGMPVNPDVASLPEKAAADRAALQQEASVQEEASTSLSLEQQNRVKDADEAALRGSQLIEDRDYAGAVYKYRLALEWLPEHEMTDPRRTAYEKQMNRAMRLSTPKDSDLHEVLKGDTIFGIASQHGVSVQELKTLNNLQTDTLRVGQLLSIPRASTEEPLIEEVNPTDTDVRLESTLKEVIIPSLEIREIPFKQAVGLIKLALDSNLDSGLFPDVAPRFVFDDIGEAADADITLRLNNVPVAEALRYVTQLANCQYEIEGNRIVIRRP